MAKRSKGKSADPEVFRDSDFVGVNPSMQSQLSTSLNTLSQRVTAAMKTLSEVPKPVEKSNPGEASPVEKPSAAQSPKAHGPDGSGGTAA